MSFHCCGVTATEDSRFSSQDCQSQHKIGKWHFGLHNNQARKIRFMVRLGEWVQEAHSLLRSLAVCSGYYKTNNKNCLRGSIERKYNIWNPWFGYFHLQDVETNMSAGASLLPSQKSLFDTAFQHLKAWDSGLLLTSGLVVFHAFVVTTRWANKWAPPEPS